jgi:energy-converting hydrogenase A subunit M
MYCSAQYIDMVVVRNHFVKDEIFKSLSRHLRTNYSIRNEMFWEVTARSSLLALISNVETGFNNILASTNESIDISNVLDLLRRSPTVDGSTSTSV